MATSKPIMLQITDIIQWYRKKELVINDKFQRYSVWKPQAKVYLIDTILNELPIPKIFIRSIIDPKKQIGVREVVDGQQRIRAIMDFADNKLRLTSKSENFQGLIYNDLDEDQKNIFLGYTVVVEQLLNASDDDVIDIFSRINSYTVSLNDAEKRHALYQSDFKFFVRNLSIKYRWFIEKYSVFTIQQRFRMADDTFFAEVCSILLNGVTDGGANKIDSLYKNQTDDLFNSKEPVEILKKIDEIITYLDSNLSDVLKTNFNKQYQLLMIIAAYAYLKYNISEGQIGSMPEKKQIAKNEVIVNRLHELEIALNNRDAKIKQFIDASTASTQRIASRKIRFSVFVNIFGK
jgi:hypothetical protein